MTKSIAALALAATVSLCLSQPAAAYQSGVNCHPATSVDAGNVRYTWSGIENISDSSFATVYCSDGTLGTAPSGSGRLTVAVIDNHNSLDVSCSLRMYLANGYMWFGSAANKSSGNASSAIPFDLPVLQLGYPSAINMACSLPPRFASYYTSSIVTYSTLPPQ
jgi:hypothetical protein